MKKILALTVSILMAAGVLAGCGGAAKDSSTATPATTTAAGAEVTTAAVDKGPFDLKLWGSQEDQEMLKGMVESFKTANPGVTYNVTYGVAGEDVAKNEVLKDPAAAADVFAFGSDQIAELKAAGVLYRVSLNKDAIIAANSPNSIASVTVDGELYAYPSSGDTYFLYYDKRLLSADDVKSIDGIMGKELPAGAINLGYPITSPWQASGFFLGAGCTVFGPDGLDDTACDFNNANGVKAAKAIMELAKNPKFVDITDATAVSGFQAGTLGATVCGTWKADDFKKALGEENYAAAKLPTIQYDGVETQLGSYGNFKVYGVNSQTKSPAAAMALAEYLTSEAAQRVRFETRSFVPTNLALSADTAALSANVAVAACAEQNKFATLQPSIPQMGKFWDPVGAFTTGIKNGSTTEANVQAELDKLVTAILTKIAG